MRRQGMVISELKKVRTEEIVEMVTMKYGKKIEDQKIMDLYSTHFEDRR